MSGLPWSTSCSRSRLRICGESCAASRASSGLPSSSSLAASRTFIIYTLFDVSGHETTASLWLSSVIVCVFISGSIVGFKLAMEASRLVEDYGVDPSAPCTAHTLHSPFTARTLHPPFTVRTRHSPCTTHTLHSLWRPHPRARTARGADASQTPCNPCLHTHRHTSARSRRPA